MLSAQCVWDTPPKMGVCNTLTCLTRLLRPFVVGHFGKKPTKKKRHKP